ncbi:hypothetical protein HOY82DRAFT_534952 [Tuber indicum]|nr:hypothetical protein HOY82DRAFT_534952 [Tuber indicum]
MSGRLSVLLATRIQRQDLAADAVLGGARKLPGQNSGLGKIQKLETDIEGMKVTTKTLSKRQDLINTYQDRADADIKWLTKVGIGSGVLGIGGAIFKLYHYDVSQTNQIKAYIREVGGNLESRMERMESRMESMESRMERMESRMDKKIGNLELKMDQKIGNLESKMDQRIGNLESKMDQKIGNLESKMDQRMDEIVSYLQAKKGWW